MSSEPKGWHSRGFLPHFDSPARVQHIVFRTKGSLPAAVLAAMPANGPERAQELDVWLDRGDGAAINRLNGTMGAVWARDYFDRYARNENDCARMVSYVEDNPVKAGLVATASDWPWSSAGWRGAQERA